MSKDLLYLHIELRHSSLQIDAITSLHVYSLSRRSCMLQANFGKQGMTYHAFAPYAKPFYLLFDGNIVIAKNAIKVLALFKKVYGMLSFKFSGPLYDYLDICDNYKTLNKGLFCMSPQDDLANNSAMELAKASESFLKDFDFFSLKQALNSAGLQQRVPPYLVEDVDALPNAPGVYLFHDDGQVPIYIGKSINLKERVLSHFSARYQHPKEMKIFSNTKRIRFIRSNGEFGALLLESQLIKKYRPIYNRRLRRLSNVYSIEKSYNEAGYLIFTLQKVEFGSLTYTHKKFCGLYKSKRHAKEHIEKIVKAHGLCSILSGLENGSGACFLSQLNQCNGACLGQESNQSYNSRASQAISNLMTSDWPYESAIAIEEKGQSSTLQWHVFDKWCYLGSASSLSCAKSSLFDHASIAYDVDASKYLSAYLKENKDRVFLVGSKI